MWIWQDLWSRQVLLLVFSVFPFLHAMHHHGNLGCTPNLLWSGVMFKITGQHES